MIDAFWEVRASRKCMIDGSLGESAVSGVRAG